MMLLINVSYLEMFVNSLDNLQVVHRLWQKNDVRGVINAMQRMSDNAVCVLYHLLFIFTWDILVNFHTSGTGLS